MSLLSRLKRLWELSEDTPYESVSDEELDAVLAAVPEQQFESVLWGGAHGGATTGTTKPTGAATIVEDSPLNIFDHNGPDAEHEGDIEF